jgi:hypothetical protein
MAMTTSKLSILKIQKPVEALILPITSNFLLTTCIQSRDPLPLKGLALFDYSTYLSSYPILHTWFRYSCFTCDGS